MVETSINYPLLQSKLTVPPVKSALVQRTRLFERLEETLDKRLAIVVSPAGFGKSSLISSWCARLKVQTPTARMGLGWLSLDELDNDPARFWHYYVRAWCQALGDNEIEQEVARLIRTFTPAPVDAILTLLINELSVSVSPDQPLVVVLDDYHLISESSIHKGISLFVERMPPGVHLALATRSDPNLPLARYRIRDWLVEVRADDLLFSEEETIHFFEDSIRLQLSREEVKKLSTRTEGWVAGLQMAGLALQGQKKAGKDTTRFIEDFAGSHRFVLDYLSEEVLANLPGELRDFLLRTSILEKFTRPLGEVVTGYPNAGSLLSRLEEANLFIIPLDDKREWYRYHHLFGEVLRSYLLENLPGEVTGLHRRAAGWFDSHQMGSEAVSQALASEDFSYAAHLMERYAPAVMLRREFLSLHNWFNLLPPDVLKDFPELSILRARFSLVMGNIAQSEEVIRQAKSTVVKRLESGGADGLNEYNTRLNAEIAAIQGMLQVMGGNFGVARELGDYAASHLSRSQALNLFVPLNLGAAYWMTGNNPIATRILKAARQDYINISNLYMARIAIAYLEGIYLSELRLNEAERECREAFELDARFLPGTTDLTPRTDYCGLYVRLGIVNYYRTELVEAEANIKLGIELARSEKNNLIVVAGLLWLARVFLVKKNVETEKPRIRQLVTEAEGIINTSGLTWLWSVHSMPVFLSDLYFRLGEEDKARYWAASFKSSRDSAKSSENNKPTAEPDLSIITELETIATGWRLLGEGKAQESLALTGKLEQVATQTGRLKGLLESLVLAAASLDKLGRTGEALTKLQEALQLAAPERVSYIFLEKYQDLASLLPVALKLPQANTFAPEFVERLVSAGKNEIVTAEGGLNLPEPESKISPAQTKVENGPVRPQPPKGNAALIEPLSERELEVLELIAQGVANQEISERLIIAMPTVKKHIGNIFAKLEVTNRVQALLRARELGLIA